MVKMEEKQIAYNHESTLTLVLNLKIGKCFGKLDISCPINSICREVDISKATSFGNILLTLESQLKSVETWLFSMDQPIHECQLQIISEDFSLKGVCEYY